MAQRWKWISITAVGCLGIWALGATFAALLLSFQLWRGSTPTEATALPAARAALRHATSRNDIKVATIDEEMARIEGTVAKVAMRCTLDTVNGPYKSAVLIQMRWLGGGQYQLESLQLGTPRPMPDWFYREPLVVP